MSGQRAKAAIVVLLALLATVGAQLWRPTQHLADQLPKLDLEAVFPQQFGQWRIDTSGPAQIVSPDQQAMLSKLYAQSLSRVYVGPRGERIMLSIAYGGDQSDATRAHRPDVCYPAQGFQIRSSSEGQVRLSAGLVRAKLMVAQQDNRIEPITYWITVGDQIALSGTEQKLAQLRYGTHGVIPDGMLVRVSSLSTNATQAYSLHERFLQDLYQSMASVNRVRVFGAIGVPA